jgi:hypothetical protein
MHDTSAVSKQAKSYEERLRESIRKREEEEKQLEKESTTVAYMGTSSPDDAQGGMCEYDQFWSYGCVDLIYCHCMRICMTVTVTERQVYDSIESYMISDQHRSNIGAQGRA